jgi:hypothetical protein
LRCFHAFTRSQNASFRYFVWLTAFVCLFQGAGYLMALSLVNFGDIYGFVNGLEYALASRLGLTVLGVILSFVALYFAGRSLDKFLGRTRRRDRAAKLVVISYFAGGVPLILASLLGPKPEVALIFAAPATLGGTIFLLYTIPAVHEARPTTNPRPAYTRQESGVVWRGRDRPAPLRLRLRPGSTALARQRG